MDNCTSDSNEEYGNSVDTSTDEFTDPLRDQRIPPNLALLRLAQAFDEEAAASQKRWDDATTSDREALHTGERHAYERAARMARLLAEAGIA